MTAEQPLEKHVREHLEVQQFTGERFVVETWGEGHHLLLPVAAVLAGFVGISLLVAASVPSTDGTRGWARSCLGLAAVLCAAYRAKGRGARVR